MGTGLQQEVVGDGLQPAGFHQGLGAILGFQSGPGRFDEGLVSQHELSLILSEPTVGHQEGDRGQDLLEFTGRGVAAQGFQLLQPGEAIGEDALEFVARDVPLAFDGPDHPRGVVASGQDVLEPGQLRVRPAVVDQPFPQGVEREGVTGVAHQLADQVRILPQAVSQSEGQQHIRGGRVGLAQGQSGGRAEGCGADGRFEGGQRGQQGAETLLIAVWVSAVRATRSRLELGEDRVEFREGLRDIGRRSSRGFRDGVGDELDAPTGHGSMEGVRGRDAEGAGPGAQIGPPLRRFFRGHSRSVLGCRHDWQRQLPGDRVPVGVRPSYLALPARGAGCPGVMEMAPERRGEEVVFVANRGRDDAGQLQAFAPGFQAGSGLSPYQCPAHVLYGVEEEQGSRSEDECGIGDGGDGPVPELQSRPRLQGPHFRSGLQAFGPLIPTAPRQQAPAESGQRPEFGRGPGHPALHGGQQLRGLGRSDPAECQPESTPRNQRRQAAPGRGDHQHADPGIPGLGPRHPGADESPQQGAFVPAEQEFRQGEHGDEGGRGCW